MHSTSKHTKAQTNDTCAWTPNSVVYTSERANFMSCLSETIFAVHAVHSFSVTVSASIHSISASHRKKATHEYSAHEVKLPKQGRSVARPSCRSFLSKAAHINQIFEHLSFFFPVPRAMLDSSAGSHP